MWIAAGLLALLLLFCFFQNSRARIRQIEYRSRLLPKVLDGFLIAHVSDVHNRPAGGPERLVSALRAQRPGLIAITGDLIDRDYPDIDAAAALVRALAAIAPVCFVSGNHEYRSERYEELLPLLRKAGARVLDDGAAMMEIGGVRLTVAGLRDPACFNNLSGRTDDAVRHEREKTLKTLLPKDAAFCLLLSHRPEFFDIYARCGVPLVLSGHAHGGQARFPIPLFSPGQGMFPRYTGGMYRRGDTAMVVSRGLGGRLTRLRVFNPPEVVMVRLSSKPPSFS